MQFQVPQFIETEDKIVGPLSIRQFIIVAIGGGVCAVLFFILQTWLWAILTLIIMGATVSLAFVKISGRPFLHVALSAFNFYWHPQTYVWQSERPAESVSRSKAAAEVLPAPHRLRAREKAATGDALHKRWEVLQSGEKISAPQFTEKKMYERYQIFQKVAGDREAARRVDYR